MAEAGSDSRVGRVLAVLLGLTLWAMPAFAVAEADPDRGEELYRKYCRGCHGADGRGGAHTFMPHVGTLTKRGYIELLPDEYLVMVITEGGQAAGKSSYMPAWGKTLDKRDVLDIIAYIRRLPTY